MNTSEITYLYRCFDREGVLLYAGITDNVDRRMRQHAADKFWWADVVRTTKMAFQTRQEALWAEWAVITTCAPLYNCAAPLPVLAEHRPFLVRDSVRRGGMSRSRLMRASQFVDPNDAAAELVRSQQIAIREAVRRTPGSSEPSVRRRVNSTN